MYRRLAEFTIVGAYSGRTFEHACCAFIFYSSSSACIFKQLWIRRVSSFLHENSWTGWPRTYGTRSIRQANTCLGDDDGARRGNSSALFRFSPRSVHIAQPRKICETTSPLGGQMDGMLVFTVTVAFLGRVNAFRFSTNCIPVTSACSIEFDSIPVFAMYD